MPLQVYINGTYYDQADAKVNVRDHGFLYGNGVFEGIRSYAGSIFRLQEHLDRLWDSAKAIAMEIPMTKKAMADAIKETLALNKITDGYIRVVISRGMGTLGIDPTLCSDPQVVIITDKIAMYSTKCYDEGLTIVTSSVIRNHPAALSPRIKSLNYLNNIMAKLDGLEAGCIEALMLNHKGEVAECTGDNIFLVRNSKLLTPPLDAGILDGITRNAILEIARRDGIETAEMPLTKHDVFIADECFLTGTAAEVIPVVKIDGRHIGEGVPGKLTKKLIVEYKKLTGQV